MPHQRLLTAVVLLAALLTAAVVARAGSPVQLGSRREPLLDAHLIDKLKGQAERRLHHPTPRGVVLRTDEPWEGNTSAYFTIFRDGGTYRMYYRGSHHADGRSTHQLTCYAESDDGIHWRKPDLGLVEFDGSKKNNILRRGRGAHNFTPFKDANPDAADDARYKAVATVKRALYAFKSPDGIHWETMGERPVIGRDDGAFDSQNLAFWDPHTQQYRVYFRAFIEASGDWWRGIKTATSDDLVNWSEPKWLKYPGATRRHLYTNQIMPHPRAPHLLIGFPTRFLPGRGDLTEGLLMSSRDRVTFHRWAEALVRPGPGGNKWQNRSNYIWWGLVETESRLPGAPAEWSLYVNEGYYEGDSTSIRRYTIRKDGFVSVGAPMVGGELITRPFTFEGSKLTLNVATAAAGSVRLELQTAEGEPIEGHALSDCPPIYGDSLSRTVKWDGEADVADIAGQPVRLRIKLKDADLYSCKFR